MNWHCRDHELNLNTHTHIMGILNVTPDSFSDGGDYFDLAKAVDRVFELQEQGADIIDIGGESTRPGSTPVAVGQEMARVIPIIEKTKPHLGIPISVDTYKSSVAQAALEAGADIVNDISGGRFDAQMVNVVSRFNAGYVIMHIKGEPRNMQNNPTYENVIEEISNILQTCIQTAKQAGVPSESIVIDPGIGFGKRLKDNFRLINELDRFLPLGLPLLVGPSRKSFIGELLDLPAQERLEGTAAAVSAAILRGAHIVRVHDVLEMKRVATVADAIVGKVEIQD